MFEGKKSLRVRKAKFRGKLDLESGIGPKRGKV